MVSEDRRAGVQELKFVLAPDRIEPVLDWMRSHLVPDPHGSGAASDAYRVESVYFDTEAFDVYHRRGSFARAKFRIRRYGGGEEVFLERKLKRDGIVRKRRLAVAPAALDRLREPVNGHRWEGAWFQRRTELRRLRPVVMMNYFRIARLGRSEEGPFRVTLDRQLRALPVEDIRVPDRVDGADLLEARAILEVKFAETLPGPIRRVVEDLKLAAAGFSKYRLGVRSCGLVVAPELPAEGETGDGSASALDRDRPAGGLPG